MQDVSTFPVSIPKRASEAVNPLRLARFIDAIALGVSIPKRASEAVNRVIFANPQAFIVFQSLKGLQRL